MDATSRPTSKADRGNGYGDASSTTTGTLHERHGLTARGASSGHIIEDLHKRVNLLEDLFRAGISFGVPLSITETGTASGMRLGHMRGAWIQQDVTALNTNVTFSHNLELQAPTGVVNVRWLPFGFRHDNTAAGAGDTVSVIYVDGTITADAIGLRVFASGARTVDADHPLKVTLFFVPADG